MYVQEGKFVNLSYLQNYPINFRMTEPADDRMYIEYNTTRYELPFTTLENNVKSHKICPAFQTTTFC